MSDAPVRHQRLTSTQPERVKSFLFMHGVSRNRHRIRSIALLSHHRSEVQAEFTTITLTEPGVCLFIPIRRPECTTSVLGRDHQAEAGRLVPWRSTYLDPPYPPRTNINSAPMPRDIRRAPLAYFRVSTQRDVGVTESRSELDRTRHSFIRPSTYLLHSLELFTNSIS